ncbi:MAG: glycosyl hydrolase [Capnocytophaga sp.]|nr:glycosyl hydrolase [Capnocytophaga sp.]
MILSLIYNLFTSCRGAFIPTTVMEHTPQTQNLYKNLKEQAKRGYMFGQHDASLYGIGWKGDADRSDVKSIVGDYPAVISFDIGRLELGGTHNLDNISFDVMRQEIIKHYERGGVISISWHVDNPLTGGDSWDIRSNKAVASVLTGRENAEKFQQWLGRVADFINSLETEQGEKIPIIFRPWHEHTGSWFWWGQSLCSTEEYKSLWRLTEQALKSKGVRNVLLAYSPGGDATNYMERYPGDDIIDLLGFDTYQSNESNGAEVFMKILQKNLKFLKRYCKKNNKIYAVTETGFEQIPNATWWTEVLNKAIGSFKPSYVLVWRNAYERPNHYYAPYPNHISEANFKEFYNLNNVFFLKDIQKMYQAE